MRPPFRFFLLIAAIGFMAVACGRNGKATTSEISSPKGRAIILSDSVFNQAAGDTLELGHLKEGEVIEQTLSLYNAGTKPVVILRTETSCGCTQVEYPRQPLKPGAKAEFSFSFDSQGFGGWVYKTISIYTSLNSRPYILVITAEIERELMNSDWKSW